MAPALGQIASKCIAQFNTDFEALRKCPEAAHDINNPICVTVLASLATLSQWVKMHEKILERHSEQGCFGFSNWAYSNDYATAFVALLGLNMNAEAESECFVAMSGLQQLDNLMNTTKGKAVQCIGYLSDYIFNRMESSDQGRAPLYTKLKALAPALIKSCQVFACHPNMMEMVDEEGASAFMTHKLELLVAMTQENVYYEAFVSNMAMVIVSVCLNLMQTTEQEARLIMNDPNEFMNLALDCCDKQKSEIVKAQACKLLENFCDNIDGATTCVATFTCNALNLALKKLSTGELPPLIAQQQGLWGMEQDPFLTRTHPIIIAETCMLGLTVISYILPKKNHLVPFFQEALAQNID